MIYEKVTSMVVRVLQALIVNNQEAIPLQYETGIFIDESKENPSRSQIHKSVMCWPFDQIAQLACDPHFVMNLKSSLKRFPY